MSLLQPCDETAEGAFVNIAPIYGEPRPRDTQYGTVMDRPVIGYGPGEAGPTRVLRETYIGRVLGLGENNGYDDSDFYAIVWDDETETTKRITYASTRGWSYDLYGATVDATPEIVERLKVLQEKTRRQSQIMARRTVSKKRCEFARKLGVRPSAIRRLEKAYGPISHVQVRERNRYSNELAYSMGFFKEPGQIDRVLKLAESAAAGKLRNEFKKKLGQQVLTWLQDPAPAYDSPLSKKQVQYV